VRIPPRHSGAIRASTLRAAARAALDAARTRRSVGLTIIIAGDALLRKLNRDFAGIDAPTDVLSFTAENEGAYLGDVIISLARAKAQAKHDGHLLIDELRLLVIHGVLHLTGYDHDTSPRKKKMWAAQAKALRKIGASIEGPIEQAPAERIH
jgi:probable rRNA maturation factor